MAIKAALSPSKREVFPFFNHPLFAFESLQKIAKYIDQLKSVQLFVGKSKKYLKSIRKMIDNLVGQQNLKKIVKKLAFHQKQFDELRILLEPKKNDNSLKVKDRISLYLNRLSPLFVYFPDLEKIKVRLEKYWDHLFCTYDIPFLPRVNNGAENFNLFLKRISRKMTGRKDNWLFIENYGPLLSFLPNFISTSEDDSSSPLEKIHAVLQEDILNLLEDITKSDMKSINNSIEIRTQEHKTIIRILNRGIDSFLEEAIKNWLEINKSNNGGDFS